MFLHLNDSPAMDYYRVRGIKIILKTEGFWKVSRYNQDSKFDIFTNVFGWH